MREEDILAALPRRHRNLLLGIGDDCAVYRPRANEDLVFTTDLFIEDVHFTRDLPAASVGRRALARSLSDIAAMAAEPRFCLVSLALPGWAGKRWIGSFYRGLLKLAGDTGTALAGGDLAHTEKLLCDVMVCGAVPRGKALRRDGARAGDLLYASGPLGGWRKRRDIVPRLDLAPKLRGKASACMDISDGLALDLHRLCVASGVSAELSAIPLLRGATGEAALHDGEDYELLYTAPPRTRVPGIRIGRIVRGNPGAITYDGRPVAPTGYDHFRNRT